MEKRATRSRVLERRAMPFLLAMMTVLVSAGTPSSAVGFSASLSWEEAAIVQNLESPGPDLSFYVLLDSSVLGLEIHAYDIHYVVQDAGAPCFEIVGAASIEGAEACFRPAGVDESSGARIMTGRVFPDAVRATERLRFDISFGPCGAVPARIFLGWIEILDENGEIRRHWAGQEITLMGGAGVSLPPVVRSAAAYDLGTGRTSVWAVVEHASHTVTLEVWDEGTQTNRVPQFVEFIEPNHILAEFDGTLGAEAFAVVSDAGKATRSRYPLGAFRTVLEVGTGNPGAFATIQEAVDAAVDGDRIRVAPGTYRELVSIEKRVWLESIDGPEGTVIDAEYRGTTLKIADDLAGPVGVIGFEIRGGGRWDPSSRDGQATLTGPPTPIANDAYTGGGVHVGARTSAVLAGNRIHSNTAQSRPDGTLTYGGGVGSLGRSLLLENEIVANPRAIGGGGIYCGRHSRDLIVGNTISENTALVGGGIFVAGDGDGRPEGALTTVATATAHVTLRSNVIAENEAGSAGGGVLVRPGAQAVVEGGKFSRNRLRSCGSGAGVSVEEGAVFAVRATEFSEHATCFGGAVSASGQLTVEECWFEGNRVDGSGGAIYLDSGEPVSITGSVFRLNGADLATSVWPGEYGGGAVHLSGPSIWIQGNQFLENEALGPLPADDLEVSVGGGALLLDAGPEGAHPGLWVVDGNVFHRNLSRVGAAIRLADSNHPAEQVDIRSNLFLDDVGDDPISSSLSIGRPRCNIFWTSGRQVRLGWLGHCSWIADPQACIAPDGVVRVGPRSIALRENQPGGCNCGPIAALSEICPLGEVGGSDGLSLAAGVSYFSLGPNPWQESSQIVLSLTRSIERSRLMIVDATGRRIRTLSEGPLAPGTHMWHWDRLSDAGLEMASGIYFVSCVLDGASEVQRLALVK